MRPIDICLRLGPGKTDAICDELNSNQLKTTLRKGDLPAKVPSRVVSQKRRRKIWSERLSAGLAKQNEALAESLLYEWLLYHRRPMLMAYLDMIEIKHKGGETEETFTKTVPPETLLGKARELTGSHPPAEVAAYLLFLDYHQESDVYQSDADLVAMLDPTPDADADAGADAGAEAADAPAADEG